MGLFYGFLALIAIVCITVIGKNIYGFILPLKNELGKDKDRKDVKKEIKSYFNGVLLQIKNPSSTLYIAAIILFSFFSLIFNIRALVVEPYVLMLLCAIVVICSFFLFNTYLSNSTLRIRILISTFIISPFILSIIFWTNYHIGNKKTEVYAIVGKEITRFKRGTGKRIKIVLENDAYKDNWTLRNYESYEVPKKATMVQFEFNEGIFGMKVLKNYKFE